MPGPMYLSVPHRSQYTTTAYTKRFGLRRNISVDCINLTSTITPFSGIGVITTAAGTGLETYSGDGGQATAASLYGPHGVAVDIAGNMYIADTFNHRIRKVLRRTGVITTVAGDGTLQYGGNGGPATSASLFQPWGVAVSASGDIYISDGAHFCVRKVSYDIITTVAGDGTLSSGSDGDGDGGLATLAQMSAPAAIAVDRDDNIYIALPRNGRIRKVTRKNGFITTVAGNGTTGFSGDGGLATSATLFQPYGVAVDQSGNIYIADSSNHRIRLVTQGTGIITTLAGDGSSGYSGDGGPAASAQFNNPRDVSIDASGNVYISDTYNHRVRVVTKRTGIITTIAGVGTPSYGGDGGKSTSAQIYDPHGIAVDGSGSIFIADENNNRLRVIAPEAPVIVSGKTPLS
jgi:trimeric autotransporter adhesin